MIEPGDFLVPAENEDEDEVDDYKGSSGWVKVAVGEGGRAVILEIDPGFGALRWTVYECGLVDPDEIGLGVDGLEGVYVAPNVRAVAWTSYEGEHDINFHVDPPGWIEAKVEWPAGEAS